jgi:hypothetical protein
MSATTIQLSSPVVPVTTSIPMVTAAELKLVELLARVAYETLRNGAPVVDGNDTKTRIAEESAA